MGWPVRNYMPIGNLLVGMAYLVRRIMENSSQVGVLSIMRSHQKSSGLISPVEVHLQKKKSGSLQFDSFITQLKSDFSPVRPLKLYVDQERNLLEKEILSFGEEVKLKEQEFTNAQGTKVICSSRPELIIGVVKENTSTEAIQAIEAAEEGLKNSWWGKKTSALQRVSVLLKASDLMLLR